MGFYPPHVLSNDAQRHGIEVLSPDVTRSGARCTVEQGAVRIGFAYVQGIGQAAARAPEEERRRNGPFRSLSDFVRRVSLKREPIENPISVGTFDQFGLSRRELLWQLGLLYRPSSGQLALPLPVEQDMVPLPQMTDWERMAADYGILALSPNYHPMALMRAHLHEGIVSTAHLQRLPDGMQVEVAGLVVCRQRPMTAKGLVFMLLEDEFGMANVVVKPQLYQRYRSLVRAEPFVLVRGELQRRDGTTNVIAQRFTPLRVAGVAPPDAHNFG
jgi:error-prone DNA polymerase